MRSCLSAPEDPLHAPIVTLCFESLRRPSELDGSDSLSERSASFNQGRRESRMYDSEKIAAIFRAWEYQCARRVTWPPPGFRKALMRIVKIPKRRGEFRTLYCPNRQECRSLRRLAKRFERKVRKREKAMLDKLHLETPVIHGFTRGRSPLTNAMCHVGKAFTVSFDLKDFFDTVTVEQLKKECVKGWPILSEKLIGLVTVDGAARQGLPTSPHVANLAAMPMDREILEWLADPEKHIVLAEAGDVDGLRVGLMVYTRYADDLTFSCNSHAQARSLLLNIPRIVAGRGFTINERKTCVQTASNGRRIITGVAVDDACVYAPREVRRKLRAARHQDPQGNRTKGLEEWCRLKCPSDYVKHTPAFKLLGGT